MIEFEEFRLDNGLQVIVHKEESTPICAFNLVYNVGSRDEDPNRTGFAHLFEHLMFGGSINVPEFDTPLQLVGGENNAFTSADLTNYYITLPKDSLETAFWLESDRMLSLGFSEKSLDVQRQVVIEEFRQRYLNQPYGDAYLNLKPLAYESHPYQWPTIGADISHIEDAKMDEVKSFFKKFYHPNNAILAITGNVEVEEIKKLAEKWFGPILPGEKNRNNYQAEEDQNEKRLKEISGNVPLNAIYLGYKMLGRTHPDYYAFDLLSDILASGTSSRFHNELVKKKGLFSDITAYTSGDLNPGLFLISGRLNEDISHEQALISIKEEILNLLKNGLREKELEKVKNKVIAATEYGNCSILNRAMGLAISKLMGDVNLVNEEINHYKAVSEEDILRVASTLSDHSLSQLNYHKA